MTEAITIVCPTVPGRADSLARCRDSYLACTTRPIVFLTVTGAPTCGIAWNAGYQQAARDDRLHDWLHFTADDITAHFGWDDAAVAYWQAHRTLAAPRILNTDGTLQSCGDTADEQPTGTRTELTRIPMIPRPLYDAVLPIIETHYYTDSWVSYQARRLRGVETHVVREMLFSHHFAQAGRLDDRLYPDYDEFVRVRDQHPREAAA